jgi:Flp pilus assembly pilin Flp
LLKIIPTLTRESKDQLGAMVLEVSALAALAAVMMIIGFKIILSGLAG